MLTGGGSLIILIGMVMSALSSKYKRIYIGSTRGCILEMQEDVYWRYKRMYIGDARGCILEVQEDIYWRYKRIYIGNTRGYILEVQEDESVCPYFC